MKSQRKNFGFLVGRFQMLHKGHEHLIDSAYDQCENLLVLVGSAQVSKTVRNPFDLQTRISMLREIYSVHPKLYIGFITDLTHENDHSHDWGRCLLNNVRAWQKFYGIEPELDAMIYGNDEERNVWFDPKDIEGVQQLQIDRSELPISATMMREYLRDNDFNQWSKWVNPKLYPFYDELRQKLYEVKQ